MVATSSCNLPDRPIAAARTNKTTWFPAATEGWSAHNQPSCRVYVAQPRDGGHTVCAQGVLHQPCRSARSSRRTREEERPMIPRICSIALGAAVCLSAAGTPALARPARINQIPNGPVKACLNCHVSPEGGGPRNPFGAQIEAGFLSVPGQPGVVLWGPALAGLNADGDGATNGAELQDPTGAWSIGQPQPGNAALVTNPGIGEADTTILAPIEPRGGVALKLALVSDGLNAPVEAKAPAAGASRGCAARRRRPCATPTGRAAAPRRRRAGTRRRRGGGWSASGPGGTRARTRRCATGARAWRGACPVPVEAARPQTEPREPLQRAGVRR